MKPLNEKISNIFCEICLVFSPGILSIFESAYIFVSVRNAYRATNVQTGELLWEKKDIDLTNKLSELVVSGAAISDTITEVMRRMEVGDIRIVGPLARRADIASCIAKLNSTQERKSKFTQSQVYPFHPASGVTMQNCFLLYRVE